MQGEVEHKPNSSKTYSQGFFLSCVKITQTNYIVMWVQEDQEGLIRALCKGGAKQQDSKWAGWVEG
jgi:hypothetical protein